MRAADFEINPVLSEITAVVNGDKGTCLSIMETVSR